MEPSTRIIINTLATYGQSLFAMAVSLFSARWVLQALGPVDFGLFSVVGSIILLITFLQGGMTVGVSRFYAFSIGRGHNLSPETAIDDLQKWFNTAFSVYLILPLVLIPLGYPIGIYAIDNWLIVPTDRVDACIWVFRVSLITAFVSMLAMPFTAMYAAHQYITELAMFGILSSCCNLIGAYLLLSVQSDRLIFYALYIMAISVGIQLLQVVRAAIRFKACRINLAYLFKRAHFKELYGYVGWKMFGMACVVFRAQGSPILVNLFFGPQVNAAYSVAQRVSVQATTLSTAMMGALQPAITTIEGQGNRQKMLDFALQACKFGTLLVLFFAIPLMLEMDTVLKLWLKNPPVYTDVLCIWMLAMLIVDRMTAGQMLAINAHGKIAVYELVQGTILAAAIPLIWFFFKAGLGPESLGYALMLTMVLYCAGRLVFCRILLQMPVCIWLRQVAVPVAFLVFCSVGTGALFMQTQSPGLLRICMTTAVCGVVLTALGWNILLNRSERAYVQETVKIIMTRLIHFRCSSRDSLPL